jgi:hypothetical protein
VPTGWVPVDEGDARVWVPPNWSLWSGKVCSSGAPLAAVVSLGELAQSSCRAMGERVFALPAQSVSLVPLAGRNQRSHYRMINGYRVYAANAAKPEPVWHLYDVPQLGVRIALRGSLTRRILDSIAPSARRVALAFAARLPPTNFRNVVVAGVAMSIPRSWAVTDHSPPCSSPQSELVVPPVHPGMSGALSCPGIGPATDSGALSDGAELGNRPSDITTGDRGRLIVVLHRGATTITVYAGYGDAVPSALEVFIRRTGSPTTHILALGLGRDGRVAGGVLASIRAVS